MQQNEKSIILHPSWKAFLWEYLFGILLIPLLIGIYMLWNSYQKQKKSSCKITDHSISKTDYKYCESIDLVQINQVQVINSRLNTGSLSIKTNSREMILIGMKNPDELKKIIEKAIAAELHRLEANIQFQPRKPTYEAGEMERMDYLTGLWQQGLISNEEFDEQKGNI